MPINRSNRVVEAATLRTTARQLLEASTLCAIATVTPDRIAHVNTAYFAWAEPDFSLVWLSDPDASHSKNIAANPTTAVAVYDSGQEWSQPDRGIQLFGAAQEATGYCLKYAQELYRRRFPAYEPAMQGGYRCYLFQPQRMKLFDEQALGDGVFVTAAVQNGNELHFVHAELSHP